MRKHLLLRLRVLVYHVRHEVHVVPKQQQQKQLSRLEGCELLVDEPSIEVLMTQVIDHSQFLGQRLHLVALLVEPEVVLQEVGELQGHQLLARIDEQRGGVDHGFPDIAAMLRQLL